MTLAEWEAFSWSLAGIGAGTVIRSMLLAGLCAVAAWLLRSRTATLRFFIWKCVLLALFALPVLIIVTPRLAKPSAALTHLQVTMLPSAPIGFVTTGSKRISAMPIHEPQQDSNFEWFLLVPAAYFAVLLTLAARLAYSLLRLRTVARRSQLIRNSNFEQIAHDIWLASGARIQPKIAASAEVTSPITFDADDNIWILLPRTWSLWSEAKLRAVLTHEMAHVQRADAQSFLMASFATCVFWFNPLAWFLQKQLAVLAEEACDECVIADQSTPEEYANFLLEFAREMNLSGGRLEGAISVVGTSSLKRRIERLFVDTTNMQRSRRLLACVAVAVFLPSVYLTAAARTGADQQLSTRTTATPVGDSLTPADVAELEAQLTTSPEDLNAGQRLLMHYALNADEQSFVQHLMPLIHDHPSLNYLPFASAWFPSSTPLSDESEKQIASAWDDAIAAYPNSPDILSNAAQGLASSNPERSLQIVRELERSDPSHMEKYIHELVSFYAAAEMAVINPDGKLNGIQMTPELANNLRSELAQSTDPALFTATGQILVMLSHTASHAQYQRGLDLIHQAISLDPGNPKWTEALTSAEAEPQRRAATKALMAQTPQQQGIVRIGGKVAEGNLINKPEPVYPAAAQEARIQGTVEFSVTVGSDGKVQSLTLVRGHPLLVNAAKDAVLQYTYHPVLLNGQAVTFQTQVLVPFGLSNQ